VGPRAGLDAVSKRRIPSPCRKSNPGRLAHNLVTILTELPRQLSSSTENCKTITNQYLRGYTFLPVYVFLNGLATWSCDPPALVDGANTYPGREP